MSETFMRDYELSAPVDPPDEPLGLEDGQLDEMVRKLVYEGLQGVAFRFSKHWHISDLQRKGLMEFDKALSDGVVQALDRAQPWVWAAVADAFTDWNGDEPDPDERRDRER